MTAKVSQHAAGKILWSTLYWTAVRGLCQVSLNPRLDLIKVKTALRKLPPFFFCPLRMFLFLKYSQNQHSSECLHSTNTVGFNLDNASCSRSIIKLLWFQWTARQIIFLQEEKPSLPFPSAWAASGAGFSRSHMGCACRALHTWARRAATPPGEQHPPGRNQELWLHFWLDAANIQQVWEEFCPP